MWPLAWPNIAEKGAAIVEKSRYFWKCRFLALEGARNQHFGRLKAPFRSHFPAEGSDGFLGTDFVSKFQKKHVVTNTSEPPVGEFNILRNSLSHGIFPVA